MVSDDDAEHGVLSVAARAQAVLERQLRLREQLVRIDHEYLFFDARGEAHSPLVECSAALAAHDAALGHSVWQAVRRAPLLNELGSDNRAQSVVRGKQHGHSLLTMLPVYAASDRGSRESFVAVVREALAPAPMYTTTRANALGTSTTATRREVGTAELEKSSAFP